jgi:hypothetical protein
VVRGGQRGRARLDDLRLGELKLGEQVIQERQRAAEADRSWSPLSPLPPVKVVLTQSERAAFGDLLLPLSHCWTQEP